MNSLQQLSFLPQWYLYSGLWRFLFSVFLVLVGMVIAKRATKGIRHFVSSILSKKQVADSPLGLVLEPVLKLEGSGILSSSVYALVLFMFIAWAGEVIGITLFSQIVNMIVAYIPNLLVALVVLSIGMLLASVIERVTKQQFKKVAPEQAVLAGTVASSITIALFVLMSLSELGIATEFILILFSGFVFSLALGIGIALGLGAKQLVENSLQDMVSKEQDRRKKSSKKSQK